MRRRDEFDGLDALVAERGDALLATATLLVGSRTAGEDLLQLALERVMRHWSRVRGDPEAYVRRTLYHLAVDEWRARRRRPRAVVLDRDPAVDDATAQIHLRHALVGALGLLPPRQRAVLVLRYWEQLSEAEAAETLGCSVGTVKSSASRGLARLRELTADWAGGTEPLTTPNGAAR